MKKVIILMLVLIHGLHASRAQEAVAPVYPHLKLLKKRTKIKNLIASPCDYESHDLVKHIDKEIKKYPPGLLEEFNVHVYLVGSIRLLEQDEGLGLLQVLATYEHSDSINNVYLVGHAGVREALHHELSSVFIHAMQYKDTVRFNRIWEYLGAYPSISTYIDGGLDKPKYSSKEFLGNNMYSASSVENDFNTIASHMFQPLYFLRHEGKKYNFYDFLELAVDEAYPVLTKIANAFAIYELIDPRFTWDFFYDMNNIPVQSLSDY